MKKIVLLTLAALLLISIIAIPTANAGFLNWIKNMLSKRTGDIATKSTALLMTTPPTDFKCDIYDDQGNGIGKFGKLYNCSCIPGYNPNDRNRQVEVIFYWGDNTESWTGLVNPGPGEERRVWADHIWEWKSEYGVKPIPFTAYARTVDGNTISEPSNYWGFIMPYTKTLTKPATTRPILNWLLQRTATRR